jgi:hypothetical protein
MARLRADILAEQKWRAEWLLTAQLDAPAEETSDAPIEEREACTVQTTPHEES